MLLKIRTLTLSMSAQSSQSFIALSAEVPIGSWQLHYVTLQVTKKFRVVFEGLRGPGTSSGGLSIDDINLSETRCPHHVWHIQNFTQILGGQDTSVYSPPFYSSKGYAFQIYMDLRSSTNVGIYFHLISGANDDQLQWPCPWQQATMTLLDQNPDIRQRMFNQRSITTDPTMTSGSWLMFLMARAMMIVQGGMGDLGVRDSTVGYLESIQLQRKGLLVENAVPT